MKLISTARLCHGRAERPQEPRERGRQREARPEAPRRPCRSELGDILECVYPHTHIYIFTQMS